MNDNAVMAAPGWFARMPTALRLVLISLASLAFVFAVGVTAGVAFRVIEMGTIRPRAAIALLVALPVLGAAGWMVWRMSAHWRRPGRSAYEQRYTRMLLTLAVLGFPLGLLLGIANGNRGGLASLLGTGAISPGLAAATAAALVVTMTASIVIYHRAIDEVERQAYLWANSLSYYFLVIALPVLWLLVRGGLIAPVGIGAAMLVLLVAILINTAVWLWLKYR
jgi:hypothetical protein